jgi:LCP family protein required for cell wall assembly
MSEDWRASFETSQTWQPDKPNKLQPVKQRHVGRWIVVLCTVVLLVPLVFGVFLLQNVAKISTNPWLIAPMPQDNGRTNILVLGSGDPGHAGENLTDTMIMLSTSRRKQHNGMVSLPRDLRVPIPGYGSGKINSAYALGGSALARQTVANITNQPVHSGLELRFSGLVTLVDQLDGLDVDVKERLYDPEYPCTSDQYKVCGLNIEAGQQHMSGQQVLAYVRCRKGTCGNDFGRAARQQEVI